MSETTSTPPSTVPFSETYQRLGAHLEPDPRLADGPASPAAYGEDPSEDRELDILLETCGLVDASADELWAMTGEDRVRFLNGQVTCDVTSLSEGGGTYGFFTTGKGRVEFDLRLFDLGDRLWLAVAPGQGQAVRKRLEKYVIIDRVAFEDPEHRAVRLVGPTAQEVLANAADVDVSDLPTEPWAHRELEIAGEAVRVIREPDFEPMAGAASTEPLPRLNLWLPVASHGPILDALVAAGASPVGHRAWHCLRVASAWPIFGVDFDIETFPKETGLEDWAVSYTKGCYLGQEVVARIHYRGGVRRAMRRWLAEKPGDGGASTDAPAWRGAQLQVADEDAGKPVGVISSAEPWQGGVIGLGIVRLEVEPDTRLRALNDEGLELGFLGVEALEP